MRRRSQNLEKEFWDVGWSAFRILGGASRNKLLTELTAARTQRPVETGHPESSTIGSFAIQLAVDESGGARIGPEAIRKWAAIAVAAKIPLRPAKVRAFPRSRKAEDLGCPTS